MDSSDLHHSLSSSSAGGHLAPGAALGPYRIARRIAMGGMGAVYEAEHLQLGRRVALKTMLFDAGGEDAQRFLNEARLVAGIDHPHVVRVFDAGQVQGVRYLAMELIDGPTLTARLEADGPLEPDDAAELIRQAAAGVHAAHLQGVLHRDVKPSNILIDPHGNARLGDFGTARDTGDARLTATGVVLGTPSYMAPEQALGEAEPTPLIDVYGLGATLYHLLAGDPPFEKASQLATMQAVVSEEAPRLRTVRPELPADLCAVCHKALAKAPEERYDSALALAQDLGRFLAGEPTQARPLGPVGQALRAVRRNAVLVATTTTLTLAFSVLALLAVLPLILSRSLTRLEQSAVAWRSERLDGLAAELDGSPAAARLRAIRADLAWEKLNTDAIAALDGSDAERAEAIRRGLGSEADHRARVDPYLARIALRLAADADPDAPELAEASIRDPEGAAGRAARLKLALRLRDGDDPRGHSLGLSELKSLARGDDAPAQRARLGLARAAAQRTEWAKVLDALAGVTGDEDAALRSRLGDLARLLTPTRELPADAAYAFIPGSPPQVVLGRSSELEVRTITATGLEPAGRADLGQSGYRLLRAFPVRGWNDVVLAAIVQGEGRLRLGGVLRRAPDRLALRMLGSYGTPGEYGMRAMTSGDFDGDGCTDLALVPYQNRRAAALVWGGPHTEMAQLDPRGSAPRRPFAVDHAVAADLDGDGRDELILAPSIFYTEVEVYRCAPDSRRMTKVATIPCGWVRSLRTIKLGRREAVIATVDYRGFERAAPKRSPERPWLGRDGVYVIEDRGSGPSLAARWTVGPDQPPDAASRFLATRLAGFGLHLGGKPWLVRSYLDGQNAPRWELTPWSSLRLEGPPGDVLRLPGAFGAPRNLVDLDGDGDPELVFGGTLHGLGAAPAGTWKPPPAERGSAPDRLLRAARALSYLGHPTAADTVRAQLFKAHPASWAAQVGQMEEINDLLWRSTRAHLRVEQAFRARDREAGRAAYAEWRGLLKKAATKADAKAEQVTLRSACLAKAARAWTALGDYAAGAERLQAALDVDGLAGDTRIRLWERKRLLDRLAGRTPVELRFEPADAPGLGILRPEGVRFVPGGIAIRCTAGVLDGYLTRVQLDPRPLRVEAHVVLDGDVWSSSLRLGVAPADDPAAMTGVEIGLHNVSTNALTVQGVVGGRATAPRCTLPRFKTELHVAMELIPMAGGESELSLEVRDAQRRLLFQTSRLVALKSPALGEHDVGVVSPRAGNARSFGQEQKVWRMTGWATVRSLRVLALNPQRRADRIPRLWNSHAFLVAGNTGDGSREALRAVEDDPAAASWALGFTLARMGRVAEGAKQLVLAAERDPHRALLWFEDLAEVLGEADRPVVDAALDTLFKHRDGLLAAIGRSMRGVLRVPVPDAVLKGAPERRLAGLHLRLRDAYSNRRWAQLNAYMRAGRKSGARMPRHTFPRVIPALTPDIPLDVILQPGRDRLKVFLRYMAATQTHPKSHRPWRRLAGLYRTLGLLGLAAQAAERELKLAPPAQRRGIWLRLASLQTSMGRKPAAVDAVIRFLEAGGRQDRLGTFDAHLGGDPRYKALRKR